MSGNLDFELLSKFLRALLQLPIHQQCSDVRSCISGQYKGIGARIATEKESDREGRKTEW